MSIKRQTVWSMLPLLVAGVSAIISVRLYLHFLSTEMYALWGYVVAYGGIFGFADLGLGIAVGRYLGVALVKNDRDALRGYWGTGNLIVLPFLLLITLTMIGVGVWLGPKWYNVAPANVHLLRACFVVGGFELFFSYYSQYWNILAQAHLDFKFIGILRASTTLLRVIPMIALAFLTGNTLIIVCWSAGVALIELLVFVWHGRRKYKLGLDFGSAAFHHAREMSVYIAKNFFGLVVGSGFGQIDRQIVGRFASAAGFLHYNIAGNFSSRLQSLSVSVMGPVFYNTTRAAHNDQKAAAKIYNDTFSFVFEWYLLAAIWIGVWHPVLVRLWLGQQNAAPIAPLLVPLVVACCFTAIANISSAQLFSLNRLGTAIGFTIAAGMLAIAGVWAGWKNSGALGAAYGFFFSRVALVAQDLFTIRLLKGGGWLDLCTWEKIGAQSLVGAAFASGYFIFQRDSYWLLIPAVLHGGLVTLWLLRHPLRKTLAPTKVLKVA